MSIKTLVASLNDIAREITKDLFIFRERSHNLRLEGSLFGQRKVKNNHLGYIL